jgi:spore coat polysaccharide biosynthesis protein SpsF (cytidylyltransferase family)
MAGAVAIVQARMSSTRLPGKSIADVGGEPMLALLLRRLQRSREIERIVVATSTEPGDDPIEDVARAIGCDVYRGPRDDVLARFVGAADGVSCALVRVTGDCPLVDPGVVDEVIRLFHRTPNCEYASNVEPRSYPDGLDVEVFSPEILRRVAAEANEPGDREHVTAVIRRELPLLTSAALVCDEQLGELRWTVDTSADLDFVREVVARLGHRRYTAGIQELLTAVRAEPSLVAYRGRRG